eukprot:gene9392-10379_t
MGFGQQIKYLLYRNFLLKRRNIKNTVYEVVSVLYFVAILAVLRSTAIKPKTDPAIKDGDIQTFPIFQTKTSLLNNASWSFAAPPNTIGYVFLSGSDLDAGKLLIQKVQNYTNGYGIKFRELSSEKALDDLHRIDSKNVSMGLIIDISTSNKNVNYTIKVPFGKVPLTRDSKRTQGSAGNSK